MDMEDNSPQTPDGNFTPPQKLDKNKIIAIIGAGVFVIILMVVVILTSGSQNTSNQVNNSGDTNRGGSNSTIPTAVPSIASQFTPSVVAKDFYDWYVNSPDPIKSGEYEKRSQITVEFKLVMGSFVKRGIDPGYDHVFCEYTELPKAVKFEDPILEKTDIANVMVRENFSDGRILFQIKLKNIKGQWLVDDVWCPPAE